MKKSRIGSGADCAAVARAFGCRGERVVDAAEVRPALERGLASGLPTVVDVVTRFVPHPALPRFAAMGRRAAGATVTAAARDPLP